MVYSFPKAVLTTGSSHNEVAELQRRLSQQGYPLTVTGRFDYDTEIAVKNFQSRMFLNPDGIVEPLTWRALYTQQPVNMPTLNQSDHGRSVEAVQELLSIDLYYTGPVNGIFGDQTTLAVKRFQADYGLPATGIIDTNTWRALSEI